MQRTIKTAKFLLQASDTYALVGNVRQILFLF